jgi:hypothetical protein
MKKSVKNKIILSTLSVLMFGGIFAGYKYYQYLSAYPLGIQEPLSETVPFEHEEFNAKDGFEYHRPSGTHIKIPEFAFQDENGNIINGNVALQFREFHTAEAIFLSGIPMQLSNDRDQFMQSLGMVELRAFQDGKELELRPGKKVRVDLASMENPSEEFKLFYLKEDELWEDGGDFKTTNNNRRDSALASLPDVPSEPDNPKPDTTDFVFELSTNYKTLPYLKPFKDVAWKMVKEKGQEIPYWALRLNWDKIKVKKINKRKNIYQLDFSWSKEGLRNASYKESCTIKAVPMLKGKALKNAMKEYEIELKKYAELAALVEKEEERLSKERSLLNSFAMEKLGICNIDRLQKASFFARVELEFDFEKEYSPEFNKVMLMMVMEEINSVLRLNAFEWDKIPVTSYTTEIVAVLPDGNIARVSPEEFGKQVNKETVSPYFTNRFYFKTERIKADDYAKKIKNNVKENPMF